jgi:hypothetical protein
MLQDVENFNAARSTFNHSNEDQYNIPRMINC